MSDRPVVETEGLSRCYDSPEGTLWPLRGLSLCVRGGDRLAVVGPSGSGKTTLLLILGLLLSPTAGRYRLAGQDVLGMDRKTLARLRREYIGFVFQSSALIDTCTVYENLELPLIYAGQRHGRAERIREVLGRVDLLERLHHPAARLSGGERQRVAIARALINRPHLILADEPTGQLDAANSARVMDYLEQSAAGEGTALLIVTHDSEVAARCRRVYRMEQGRLWDMTRDGTADPHATPTGEDRNAADTMGDAR